jgi:hypothetical protein
MPSSSRRLIVVALPRGMAAGVLSTMPAYAGVPNTEMLPVLVFACVITTIAIFTGGFWWFRPRGPAEAQDLTASSNGVVIPLSPGASSPAEVGGSSDAP